MKGSFSVARSRGQCRENVPRHARRGRVRGARTHSAGHRRRDRCRRRHGLPGQGSGTACHAAPTEGGGRPRAPARRCHELAPAHRRYFSRTDSDKNGDPAHCIVRIGVAAALAASARYSTEPSAAAASGETASQRQAHTAGRNGTYAPVPLFSFFVAADPAGKANDGLSRG